MTNTTVVFKGASGRQYTYYVNPKGTLFLDNPGNYCFGKHINGTITPLYFGECESLKGRNYDNKHERGPCADARGWNVTCAHTSSNSKSDRCAEETDLRRAYDPPCNRQ
jgi:hypothetical protein